MIDLEQATDEFVLAAGRYRDGLSTSPPLLDDAMLGELGCIYVTRGGRIRRGEQAREPEDGARLLRLLIAAAPCAWASPYIASLLSGIQSNKTLSYCVSTEDGAHAVAIALTAYLEGHDLRSALDRITTYHVSRLLNEWGIPVDNSDELPSAARVCEHLFGKPWCSVALAPSAYELPNSSTPRNRLTAELIAACRPPFLAGWCAGQVVSVGAQLPVDLGQLC
jgi:hypothetical protein